MFYISKIGLADGHQPAELQVYTGWSPFAKLNAQVFMCREPDFDELLEVVLCLFLVVRLCERILWMIILAALCGTAGILEVIVGGAGSWELGSDSYIGVATVLSGLRLCIMMLSVAAMDNVRGGAGATSYNT